MDKLKPCPFCGSSNLYIGELNGPLEDGITIYVRCLDCGATIEGEGVNEDEDTRREWAMNDAAARWNRRKGEDAILESLADMYYYANEVYKNCGGDEENRGRAPRMRGEIKNAEAILKKWGWLDV